MRDVGERVMAVIAIEGIVLIGEVSLKQVQPAVVIEVGNSDAHAPLLAAIPVDGSARNEANLFEGTVAVIVVKEGRSRIIRNVDINEAVFVEIAADHSQPIIPIWIGDSGLFGYVAKRAISIIVEELIAGAGQSPGTALDGNAFVLAGPALPEFREMVDVEINVIGNEQVEP